MGRNRGYLDPEHIESYLKARFRAEALLALTPLGEEGASDLKDYGYGKPLMARFSVAGGEERRVVIRTMSPDPFGHERRADRVAALFLARDIFSTVPRHVRALDAGTVDDEGRLVSEGGGEPFLVTTYVEGSLYAGDLEALAGEEHASAGALARAAALADYLVALHAERAPPAAYGRALRDVVGSGEGIFGLCDAYPEGDTVAPPDRLLAIQEQAVRWRWQLQRLGERTRRTHGDFHPFNILFGKGTDLTVLDASRGGAGEPADDATCLTINYLFFALHRRGRFDGALRELWDHFWQRYLDGRADTTLCGVVAPFFAWRALVLACPVWYPAVAPQVRDRLLRFAEGLLDGMPFVPSRVEGLLA